MFSHRTHMRTRRKLGLALVGGSVIAGVTIQLLTGRVVRAETEREERLHSRQDWVVVSVTELHWNFHYAFPLAGCLALGVGCVLWPSRKPPRLVL